MTDAEKIHTLRVALLFTIQNMPSHFPSCSYDISDTRVTADFCTCNMSELRRKAHEVLEKTK